MSNDKVWHTGTIDHLDKRPDDECIMRMVKVNFGQAHTAEYIGLHSTRIQKPHSQTTLKDMDNNSVAIAPEILKVLQDQTANLNTSNIDSFDRI